MHEDYIGLKLCIFIGENDKYEGLNLYEVLMEVALDSGLSGGTVIRGREGFGAHGEIHSMKILRIAENLPLVLEFVGRQEKIDGYVTRIQPMVSEGLLTRTEVRITKFRSDDKVETRPTLDEEDPDFIARKDETAPPVEKTEPLTEVIIPEQPEAQIQAREDDESAQVDEKDESQTHSFTSEQSVAEPEIQDKAIEDEDDTQMDEKVEPLSPDVISDQPEIEPDVPVQSMEDPGESSIEEEDGFVTIDEAQPEAPPTTEPEAPEPINSGLQIFDDGDDDEPEIESFEDEDQNFEEQAPEPTISYSSEPDISFSAEQEQPSSEAQDLEATESTDQPASGFQEDEEDPMADSILQMLKQATASDASEAEPESTEAQKSDHDSDEPEVPEAQEPDSNEVEVIIEETPHFSESTVAEPAIDNADEDLQTTSETTPEPDQESEQAPPPEAEEEDDSEPKMYDEGHTIEDMKNYFSSIIKGD